MIFDLSVYLAVFTLSALSAYVFQHTIRRVRIRGFLGGKSRLPGAVAYCLAGCFFLLPVIAMYGLRYGVGTDYFSYESIFNIVHGANLEEYWTLHNENAGAFYVEPAYYFLNRLFPNYRLLLWGLGVLLFGLFLLAVKDYGREVSVPFALYVFLSTQFIYSLNGVRFSVAACLILLGYDALSRDKILKFALFILAAWMFHSSALICLSVVLLKEFKNKRINRIRNTALFLFILLFPLTSNALLGIAENLPTFERYFSTALYVSSETMRFGWMWILHVLLVLLPLVIFCQREIFSRENTKVYFRISVIEILFRMLGLYNTWYTRLARYSQVAQVIFVPLVLNRVKNQQKRIALYAYYIAWYAFYFAYFAIVNDKGDSLPYVWIFSP